MFSAYIKELFYFDQFYRGFNENADAVEKAGWDVLKPLREAVENCYTGWYFENLELAWGDFLESDDGPGLLDDWCLPGICNQEEFFREFVEPVLKSNPRNRIFVIASDALRYETAEEFTREINSRYRLKADLSAMLGVVPGYTALGMASLLPHNTLSFTEKTDAVSERVHPRALKISIREGNTLISSEETITFDSQSTSMEDRTRSIKLNLTSGPFDITRPFDLVLRHADDDTEYERLSLY